VESDIERVSSGTGEVGRDKGRVFGDVPETNVGNIGWRDRKPLSRTGRGQIGALVVSG
jgi:hypothetical protein